MVLEYEVFDIKFNTTIKEIGANKTVAFIRVYGTVDNKCVDFDNEILMDPKITSHTIVSERIAECLSQYTSKIENTDIETLVKSKWLMNAVGV